MSWETGSSMQIVVNVASGQVVCHYLAIAALFIEVLSFLFHFFLIGSFLCGLD